MEYGQCLAGQPGRPPAQGCGATNLGSVDWPSWQHEGSDRRVRAPSSLRRSPMSNIEVTQAEADALLELKKHRIDSRRWEFPHHGGHISVPLVSSDKRENFLLDLRRARITISKNTYQTRARHVVVLARLDMGGGPHRNPDGEKIGTPHLHLYRQGYADRWAFVPPNSVFAALTDPWQTLQDFMTFCRIVDPPVIDRSLFT